MSVLKQRLLWLGALIGAAVPLLLLVIVLTPLSNWLCAPLILTPTLQPADAIVILGSGIYPDSSLSEDGLERVIHGIRLYRAGFADTLVFCGEKIDADCPLLADVMAHIAVELGVPPTVIVKEATAQNTYEEAITAQRIIRRHGWQRVLLVTSGSHIRRATRTFKKVGITVYPAPTSFHERYARREGRVLALWSLGREYGAWVYGWLRGWV